MLIPSAAAGAIIGKGGETIAELQKQSGARIKMSKANDFYPGTNERVCLITGNLESVNTILNFINEKIREKPDPNARAAVDFDNKVTAEREKQIKLLIPNTTAGMIIGKGGSFIKSIKDISGAFVQLSQKSKDATLSERVVTIIGEPENNRQAMQMILQKIEDDPQSGVCLNISYSDVNGLVANFNPTGSPFALHNGSNPTVPTSDQQTNNHSPSTANCGIRIQGSNHFRKGVESGPFVLPLATGGALNLKFNMNPGRTPTDPSLMAQYLNHIAAGFSSSGYSDAAAEEIVRAMRMLASHGVLVINLQTPTSIETQTAVQCVTSTCIASTPLTPQLQVGQVATNNILSSGNQSDHIPHNHHHPPPHHANTSSTKTVIHQQHQIAIPAAPPPHFMGHGGGLHHPAPPPAATSHPHRGLVSFQQDTSQPPHHVPATSYAGSMVNAPVTYSRYWSSSSTCGADSSGSDNRGGVDAAALAPNSGFVRGNNPRPVSPATVAAANAHFVPSIGANNNSFGLGLNVPTQAHILEADAHHRVEIEINENIIGAVIGPSGRCIVDIQQFSGAKIQISKKGTFSPGTRNRIVTITGSQEAISTAKYMIEQKISEEESKREKNAY